MRSLLFIVFLAGTALSVATNLHEVEKHRCDIGGTLSGVAEVVQAANDRHRCDISGLSDLIQAAHNKHRCDIGGGLSGVAEIVNAAQGQGQ